MERLTIALDDDLARQLEGFCQARGYVSRSEAFRDLVRAGLGALALPEEAQGLALGVFSYICAHNMRELAARLAQRKHDRHDLIMSASQIPLDHNSRLEVLVMHGPAEQIRTFATETLAERGIKHGQLHIMPAESRRETHKHGPGDMHEHLHLTVLDKFR